MLDVPKSIIKIDLWLLIVQVVSLMIDQLIPILKFTFVAPIFPTYHLPKLIHLKTAIAVFEVNSCPWC